MNPLWLKFGQLYCYKQEYIRYGASAEPYPYRRPSRHNTYSFKREDGKYMTLKEREVRKEVNDDVPILIKLLK